MNDLQKPVNRPQLGSVLPSDDVLRRLKFVRAQRHRSEAFRIGMIVLVWICQFLSFSLERYLHEPQAETWPIIGTRVLVTAVGVLISVALLRLLERGVGQPFTKRALIALGLALVGAVIHSVINTAIFTVAIGSPIGDFSIVDYASLVYLFSWVYLAVTIILLSMVYGEELQNRDLKIAELASRPDETRGSGTKPTEPPYLWLSRGTEKVRVEIAQIDWVGAEGEYVRFHCGADSFLERDALSAVERRLAAWGFVRIHRSAVVNVDRIKRLKRTEWGALEACLGTGVELRVSKTFQPVIRKLIQSRA